jgi:hypothetical protein
MLRILLALLMVQAASSEQLRITLYDGAQVPREIIAPALEDLRRILRQAGIELEVFTGDPTAPEASFLQLPNRPRKGEERAAACQARRDIALEILKAAPPGYQASILGYAQPLASAGLNVRVFNDRVRLAATGRSRLYAAVLAHVIAHEIGHVLLRTGKHTSGGLMSQMWGDGDYAWMSRTLMLFDRRQGAAMRREISGAECLRTAPADNH